ncbi:MAG TPA: hypothetical protein VNX60_06695 [Candidatus Acidoferrum sp.]|nr:hypothetical protein [Candidatus Acidoferrum sp.]
MSDTRRTMAARKGSIGMSGNNYPRDATMGVVPVCQRIHTTPQ